MNINYYLLPLFDYSIRKNWVIFPFFVFLIGTSLHANNINKKTTNSFFRKAYIQLQQNLAQNIEWRDLNAPQNLKKTSAMLSTSCGMDIFLINDQSGSVDAVENTQSRAFISAMATRVGDLSTANDDSRFSISEFAHAGTWHRYAFASAAENYTTEVSDVLLYEYGTRILTGGTSIYQAMKEARTAIISNPVIGRTTPKVVVLMTDAWCFQIEGSAISMAQELKNDGYYIVVMAIGPAVACPDLNTIASPGGYFSAVDYQTLENNVITSIEGIFNAACTNAPPYVYIPNYDLTPSLTSFTASGCDTPPGTFSADYTVTNLGDADFSANLKVAFYDADPALPSAKHLITVDAGTQTITAGGGTYTGIITDIALASTNLLYAVVNIDGDLAVNAVPLTYALSSSQLNENAEEETGNNFNAITRVDAGSCAPQAKLEVSVTNTGLTCDDRVTYEVTICNNGNASAGIEPTPYADASFVLTNTDADVLPFNWLIEWQKSFGGTADEAISGQPHIRQTSDGNYFIVGTSTSGIGGNKTVAGFGSYDIWIIKIDANGNKLWEQSYGGSAQELFSSVVTTADGGAVISAHSQSGISGNKTTPNYGGPDYWLFKIDANGNFDWQKSYGGLAQDSPNDLKKTLDGGYIIAGTSPSGTSVSGNKTTSGTGFHYWVVKVDANGNYQWDNSYSGSGNDALQTILPSTEGYIIAGTSNSPISGDKTENSSSNDYWVLKLSSTGSIIWENTIGGSGTDNVGRNSIYETSSGDFIIGGISNSGIGGDKTEALNGNQDIWLVKLNGATGAVISDEGIGAAAGSFSGLFNIYESPVDNGLVLVGFSFGGVGGDKTEITQGGTDYWLLKLDESLNIEWEKGFGGTGEDNASGIEVEAGAYIISGYTTSGISGDKTEPAYGQNDFWVINAKQVEELSPNSCFTVQYTYDVSSASSGNYDFDLDLVANSTNGAHQDPIISPDTNFIIGVLTGRDGFDGSNHTSDDVTVAPTSACPAGDLFSIAVDIPDDTVCEQGYTTATVTIINNTGGSFSNIDLALDLTGTGTTYASELYSLTNGLVLPAVNTTDASYPTVDNALFTGSGMDTLAIYTLPNGTSTFIVDLEIGTGLANLSAQLLKIPTGYNATNESNIGTDATGITGEANPTVSGTCPGAITSVTPSISLNYTVSGATTTQWVSGTNGTFSAPNSGTTNYTVNAMDVANGFVDLSIIASTVNNCQTVENCRVDITGVVYDYGDAPASYDLNQTTIPVAAASTILTDLFLGTIAPDTEGTTLANGDATGDGADEDAMDGVSILQPAAGTTGFTIPVEVTNNSASIAYLTAFIDWNEDGDFLDEGENSTQITIAASSGVTTNNPSFDIPNGITVPTSVFTRLRLSTDSRAVEVPYGPAAQGETEDILFMFEPDKDGDSIPDNIDIDDDNDGITDTDEGFIPSTNGNRVVFIIDDSNTIDATERADMQVSIQAIADQIESNIIGAGGTVEIAVIQYGHDNPGATPENADYSIIQSFTTNPTISLPDNPNFREDHLPGSLEKMRTDGIFTSGGALANPNGFFIFSDANRASYIPVSNGFNRVSVLVDEFGDGSASANSTAALDGFGEYIDLATTYNAPISFYHVQSDASNSTSGVQQGGGSYIRNSNFVISSGEINTLANTITNNLVIGRELDTDNDGTPDHCDLDSDGDGCYDKIEAGVTGYTSDGSVTDSLAATTAGEVGMNGLDDDIESDDTGAATTSGSYTITQTNGGTNDFQDAAVKAPDCPCFTVDSDSDGVCDAIDIDDDNDGIRDVDEGHPIPVGVDSDNDGVDDAADTGCDGTIVSIAPGSNAVSVHDENSIGGAGSAAAINSDDSRAALNATGDYLVMDLGLDVPAGTIIEVEARVTNNLHQMSIEESINAATFSNLQNYTWAAITTEEVKQYTLSATARYIRIRQSVDNGSGALQVDNVAYQAFNILVCNGVIGVSPTDTDMDGTPDYLDLDSDGDGCYDKIEAGVTGFTINGSVADSLAATTAAEVGANGLDNDIESDDTGAATTSGSYTITQTNGGTNDFQDAAVQAPACPCLPDSDGDGVCDADDIDDDNDGIPDTDECLDYLAQNTNTQWKGATASMVTYNWAGALGYDANGIHTYQGLGLQQDLHIFNSEADVQYIYLGDGTFSISFSPAVPANEIAFTITNVDAVSQFAGLGLTVTGTATTNDFFSNSDLVGVDAPEVNVTYNPSNGFMNFGGATNNKQILVQSNSTATVSSLTVGMGGIDGSNLVYVSWYALDNCDSDNDGISNTLDVDSDNDGCFDAIEAGHGQTVDVNGRIATTIGEVGANGLDDDVETTAESAIVNYTYDNTQVSIYDFRNALINKDCPETNCSDGIDNDGEDLTDCDDSDCNIYGNIFSNPNMESKACYQNLSNLKATTPYWQLVSGTGETISFDANCLTRPTDLWPTYGLTNVAPSEGDTYIAFHNNNAGSTVFEVETVVHTTSTELVAGRTYGFEFDAHYMDFSAGPAGVNTLANPCAVRVYGIQTGVDVSAANFDLCDASTIAGVDFLGESATVTGNSTWGTYNLTLSPAANYDRLVFHPACGAGCFLAFDKFRVGIAPTIAGPTDCSGDLTATITPTPTSYQWYKDSVALGGATNATYTPTESGSYTVTGVTTSGCESLWSTAYILDCSCTEPSGTDTDGDGLNDVCDIDDDNDGILDVDECPLLDSNCTIELQNTSVEGPLASTYDNTGFDMEPHPSIMIVNENLVPNWQSSATDNAIEIWDNTQVLIPGLTAYAGNQWFELNAFENAGIFQEICTVPGSVLNWSVAHRARVGTDVMRVLIGPSGGSLVSQGDLSTTTAAWTVHSGTYTVPAGQTTTILQFDAVSTGSGDVTVGNFLDEITLSPVLTINELCDIDNDGIPNHLDLDSDGDGCYDKIEAGVTGFTTDGSVTDSLAATTALEVGNNGLDNDIESDDTQAATTSGSYTITQTNAGTNDFQDASVMIACQINQILVEFTDSTAMDDESIGGNLPTLTVSGGVLTAPATIELVLNGSPGTATVGVDYLPSFGTTVTVNIPAGDYITPQIISLTTILSIVDDSDAEPDETFSIDLSNPQGTSNQLIIGDADGLGNAENNHIYTIIDNDCAPNAGAIINIRNG